MPAGGFINIRAAAIKVKQRSKETLFDEDDFSKENDFFIFSLPSNIVLDIAKFLSRTDSPLGVQRAHKEDRDKEIGQFISSEHPFFPNSIILNIPLAYKDEFYDPKKSLLTISVEEKSAYVIDGQHRLKAFASKYSKGNQLDLVVAAYFGLELPTIAEIFTRINYYQKPVSKSLVYDLLAFNKDPDFVKYKEAHEIVSALNSNVESPLYGMIKMLGIGTGHVSQASLVEALTTKYHILELLGSSYSMQEKVHLLERYFAAVRKNFAQEWNNSTILLKSVGFNALVKTLRFILVANLDKKKADRVDFHAYASAMRQANVDYYDKSAGGFKGVNILAEKFNTSLASKGLL